MQQYEAEIKLFVSALPFDITQDELMQVFRTYGEVAQVTLMSGQQSATGQACAFVCYSRRQSGEDAIAVLDNVYKIRLGDGVPAMRVAWALPAASLQTAGGPPPQPQLGAYASNSVGTVPSASVPGDYSYTSAGGSGNDSIGQSSGSYGTFTGWGNSGGSSGGYGQYGSGAASAAPQTVAPRSDYYATQAQSPDSGQQSWGGQTAFDTSSSGGSKLFVGNLPGDTTKEALEFVFGNYGQVTNTHIMTGKSKSGQVCAFVEYSKPDAAQTAILTLHMKYEIKPGEGAIIVKAANAKGSKGSRPAPY